jgi:hypothetical protein
MEDRFRIVEKEFEQLRDKFRKKELSESDFKKKLKGLRLQDQNGRFWTIGAQTGKWYYFDGNDWIESNPPSLQEKKAICIYCGFENDLENESCAYCGESFKKEEEEETEFVCPKCGRKLDKYSFFCPDCDITETPEEKVWETGEFFEAEKEEETVPPGKLEPGIAEEEAGERFEQVLRSIQPFSMLLFFGAIGLLFGIVLGAFAGATEFLMDGARILPPFLRELQGSLIGGIFYGLLGGIFGFVALGLLGFTGAHLFNVVFSLIGGIKIHIEKTP